MASDRSPDPLAGVIFRRDFGPDGEETGEGRVQANLLASGGAETLVAVRLGNPGLRTLGTWVRQ